MKVRTEPQSTLNILVVSWTQFENNPLSDMNPRPTTTTHSEILFTTRSAEDVRLEIGQTEEYNHQEVASFSVDQIDYFTINEILGILQNQQTSE